MDTSTYTYSYRIISNKAGNVEAHIIDHVTLLCTCKCQYTTYTNTITHQHAHVT